MHKMIAASNPVFFLMLGLLVLNGCAMQPFVYGNFIQNPSPAHSKVMADDVAEQLKRLYPAANTQFNLRHEANDPFGHALIENLRMAGFAVQEAIKQPIQQQIFAAPHQPDIEPNKGLILGYLIDQSSDLYHINILINDMRISRAFMAEVDGVHPAGLWVRKE